MKMKQTLALLLALIMCLSLCACGSEKQSEASEAQSVSDAASGTPAESVTDAAEGHIAIGEEVETNNFRFTLKAAEFTDKILVCNGEKSDKDTFANAEEFFTPSDKPFVDEDGYVIEGIHGFAVKKDSDVVFLYYNLEMEFIGKEEYDYVTYEFEPIVKYSDYTFDSDYMAFGRIIDEVKFNNRMWFNFNTDDYTYVKALGLEIGGFDDELKPLSSDVYEIRGIIQVPKTVAENTEESVSISFCGQEFIVR